MKAILCDICKQPKANYRIRYKAKKKHFISWIGTVWDDIDICEKCMNKIIKAKDQETEDD